MGRKALFGVAILVLAAIALLSGCPTTIENSITSELLKPVSVVISGKISALDTGSPISGIVVKIQQLNPLDDTKTFIQDGTTDASATSAADGTFTFAKAVELDVDSYQNYLYLSDPASAFFDSDTTVIYAMKDSTLAYTSLKMAAKAPASYTVVSGTVKDLLDSTAVAGVKITLTNSDDSTKTYTGTSVDSTGSFSIDKVPIAFYSLELDGSALTTAYIKESGDLVLENTPTNALGDLLVSKASSGDDLRIVLSWTNRALDLDSSFNLPNPNFNFNHLGIRQVPLPSSIISVNPAFKFAEGTAYWPENMGGAEDAGNRTLINKGNKIHTVSTVKIVELDKNSADGALPEVTTIYKQNPLTSYPGFLAYNYNYTKANTNYTYFPVGMGVFSVVCNTPTGSIYDSGATVKIYQGSTYLGKFSVADLTIDQGESNRRYWPVLQVEIGYTKASPTAVTDIYYRVVPYGSAGALPDSRFPGYFYQETYLPGNESFTVWMNQNIYGKDYDLSAPPYITKLAATKSGKIYSYDIQTGTNATWKLRNTAPLSTRPFTMGFYTPLLSNTLYLAQEPSLGSDQTLFYSGRTDYLDAALTFQGTGAGITVSDAAIVTLDSDVPAIGWQRFTLMATSAGPRGTSTMTGHDALNLNSMFDFWEDDPVGGSDFTPSTGITSRQLTHVLSMRDSYGAIGSFALIGGEGLFLFSAVYHTWDGVSGRKSHFETINASGYDLSIASNIVRAIAQQPVTGASARFMVAITETPAMTNKLYQLSFNLSGGGLLISSMTPPSSPINDILYIKDAKGNFIAICATDAGLYLWDANQNSWRPYLADMLGGFKITKLFDYDGKLGLFAEGNGLIYGPYPQ